MIRFGFFYTLVRAIKKINMKSFKRIKSICHSISHHAVSGLSYLHPYLYDLCKIKNIDKLTIRIEEYNPYPYALDYCAPLETAIKSLKSKIYEILNKEGFIENDIERIWLDFYFPSPNDGYSINCFTLIRLKSGIEFVHGVDFIGKSIKNIPIHNINRSNNSLHLTGDAPAGELWR